LIKLKKLVSYFKTLVRFIIKRSTKVQKAGQVFQKAGQVFRKAGQVFNETQYENLKS